jgi:hypothetical protein
MNKSLPERASLVFEKKQARRLVREFSSGDDAAIARVTRQLPDRTGKIGLRDAQLIIAREYGYPSWVALCQAIANGASSFDLVLTSARNAIDRNDVDRLKELVISSPALLTWKDEKKGDVLLSATTSYANFPGAENEDEYNRPECAELLLAAGALVDPSVIARIIDTGAHGMLALFKSKGALPADLRVSAALNEDPGPFFDKSGRLQDIARPTSVFHLAGWPQPNDDLGIVSDAFLSACRLGHRETARALLARCYALDPLLEGRVANWQGEPAFLDFLFEQVPEGARFGDQDNVASLVWQRTLELRLQVVVAEGDVEGVHQLLTADAEVIDGISSGALVRVLEIASYTEGTLEIVRELVAKLNMRSDAGPSPSISYALEYGHADYVPLLTEVWSLPDDLPHAAGMGDLTTIEKWFDAKGNPNLGDVQLHYPFGSSPQVSVQDILDRSLAWAVQNGEYVTADFMLEHGADINTRWSTHEPASILHECAIAGRMEQIKYLVGHGIDLEIVDHRFESTAEGWARFNGQDEAADYLAQVAARGS